jgi:hypothetical protein
VSITTNNRPTVLACTCDRGDVVRMPDGGITIILDPKMPHLVHHTGGFMEHGVPVEVIDYHPLPDPKGTVHCRKFCRDTENGGIRWHDHGPYGDTTGRMHNVDSMRNAVTLFLADIEPANVFGICEVQLRVNSPKEIVVYYRQPA